MLTHFDKKYVFIPLEQLYMQIVNIKAPMRGEGPSLAREHQQVDLEEPNMAVRQSNGEDE